MIECHSAHHFSSGMSPPDTSGKLGGASFLLSGAAAFSSETSSASEPPPLGSQAPVSASSPVLIGANSISLVLHDLHDVVVDAARVGFAHDPHDGPCCERDSAECRDYNCNDLKIKHDCFSVIRWIGENTE